MIPFFSNFDFQPKGVQQTPSNKQPFPNTRSSYAYYQEQQKSKAVQQSSRPQKFEPLRPLSSYGFNNMLAPTSSNISISRMALRNHIHFDDKLNLSSLYHVDYIEDPIVCDDILQTEQSSESFEQPPFIYGTYTGSMSQVTSKFGNLSIAREIQDYEDHSGKSSSEDSIFGSPQRKREIKAAEKTEKKNQLKAQVPNQIKEKSCGGKICRTTQIKEKNAIKSQKNNSTRITTTVKRSQRLKILSSNSGDVKDIQQKWQKAMTKGKIQNLKVGFIENSAHKMKKDNNKQTETESVEKISTDKKSIQGSTKQDSQASIKSTKAKASGNKTGNKKLKQDEACKSYFRGSRKVLRRLFHSWEKTKMRYTYLWKDNVLWEKVKQFLVKKIQIKKPSNQEIAAMGLIIAKRFAPREVKTADGNKWMIPKNKFTQSLHPEECFLYKMIFDQPTKELVDEFFKKDSFISKIWHFTKSATLFDFFKEESFKRLKKDVKNTADQKKKSREQLTYDMYNVYTLGHAMAQSWERKYPPINHREQSIAARTEAAQLKPRKRKTGQDQ
eukprot:403375697